MELRNLIRDIPDFPKKGIIFKDITTLLKNPEGLRESAELICSAFQGKGITKVVGIESRGFILGGYLAAKLGAGFVPVRKPGKLPAEKMTESYELEYGSDSIQMHTDAIVPGEIVLIHDDLLATGGTAKAACSLVERAGGQIAGLSFIIELAFLPGREKLKGYDIHSLISYSAG